MRGHTQMLVMRVVKYTDRIRIINEGEPDEFPVYELTAIDKDGNETLVQLFLEEDNG